MKRRQGNKRRQIKESNVSCNLEGFKLMRKQREREAAKKRRKKSMKMHQFDSKFKKNLCKGEKASTRPFAP